MGLHTGTPLLGPEGYVGIDLHRGARVGALAHGGQIVVSPASAGLLAIGAWIETAVLALLLHRRMSHAHVIAGLDGFVAAESRRDLKPVLQYLFADPALVSRSMVEDLLKYKRLDGVQAALRRVRLGLSDNWLRHVQDVRWKHDPQLSLLATEREQHDRCVVDEGPQPRLALPQSSLGGSALRHVGRDADHDRLTSSIALRMSWAAARWSSFTMHPSARNRTRSAIAAAFASCVTITVVWP